ncbi:MAG: phosphoglycerate mutase family protein [Pyrinomonadaceae bacterium]
MDEAPETKTRLRTTFVFALLFALLVSVIAFAYFATFARPVTTVILLRHAEKNIEPNNPNPDLSPAGVIRSQELARMLAGAGINAIFATQYKRTQQTVEPLANRTGVPVTVIDAKQSADLAKEILTNHRGQLVVMAGHNNTVPEVITALGGPAFGIIPENEFDNMFIVTIYRFGKAKVVKIKYGAESTGGTNSGMMMP